MTNLQAQEPLTRLQSFFTRERVLWGVPALVGGLAALGIGGFLALPSWQKLQDDRAQVSRLTALLQQVPQLKNRIERAQLRHSTAQVLQSKLLSVIAGSGDISTFMAQIGAEASRSGVQLDSYEPNQTAAPAQPGPTPIPIPTPIPTPIKPASPPEAQKASEPPDPLLAPGLQKTSLLITAHGSAPNVLTFLRRLESLSLLVVQSDLSLKQQPSASPTGTTPASAAIPAASSTTTLKLTLTLYSKQAPVSSQTPSTPARS